MRERLRITGAVVLAGVAALGGCASSEPLDMSLGSADEVVDVVVVGDGFVRTGERRIPRETLVLELRQRARAMTAEQLAAFRVHLEIGRDADAAVVGETDWDWLIDQLNIAGIGQGRVTFQR